MSCRLPHKYYRLSDNEKVRALINRDTKVAVLIQAAQIAVDSDCGEEVENLRQLGLVLENLE